MEAEKKQFRLFLAHCIFTRITLQPDDQLHGKILVNKKTKLNLVLLFHVRTLTLNSPIFRKLSTQVQNHRLWMEICVFTGKS
jgi:hypothetical protein